VLEAAMGWYGGHLHAFDAAVTMIGQPDPEWDDDLQDERKIRVADVLTDVGSSSPCSAILAIQITKSSVRGYRRDSIHSS
jgi:hypothetical protein